VYLITNFKARIMALVRECFNKQLAEEETASLLTVQRNVEAQVRTQKIKASKRKLGRVIFAAANELSSTNKVRGSWLFLETWFFPPSRDSVLFSNLCAAR
jgi:hypothetical protein